MAYPRRGGRSRFTLVLLVLASITILTLDFRDSGPVKALREGVGTVLSPLRSLGDTVGEPIGDAWNSTFHQSDTEEENEELRREVERLKGIEMDAEKALRDAAALRKELDIRDLEGIDRATARVISGPLTSFDATMEIDKGSGDGIKEGMPVVTQAGLVGRVVRVTGDRSQIELMTDPEFRFGVRLLTSGDVGMAQGTASGNLVIEDGIDDETPVEEGEAVITSGYDDSAFPPQVNVGRVSSVRLSADRTSKVVEVEPLANLRGLTFVTVLLCDAGCR